MKEYEHLSSLPAVAKLVAFCEEHQICVAPALTEGELTDSRVFSRLPTVDEISIGVDDALTRGECLNVEFKQTLFLNVRRLEKDPTFSASAAVDHEISHEVVKTINAFMNSGGGTLLIGVCDNGDCYGLENEFPYLPGAKKDRDAWELFFWQTIENCLEEFGRFRSSITGTFVRRSERDIFAVIMKPIGAPICVCKERGGQEHVYVRSGNRSKKLKLREIVDLIRERMNP
ncbi:AlbA family DNA-binding domain-containing protein [Mesorhizobium sp. Cs1299R1N3]|uniref:AlbA family DNA-binding domain-containing protein n=1 Tax=Mesorhizobium sp. Cs1299R1N3 TaxID=3015173 RepID=UPI00301C97E4